MRVTLDRIDGNFLFRGRNENGTETHFDTSPEDGGSGTAPGPMQTVAMALGACSGIDVVSILRKGREDIVDFHIDVDYERAGDRTPAVFTEIHVHYALTGELDLEKVRRAVDLSVRKYCSVAKMLENTATITYSFSVNGETYE